jgi:PAS domain-containing protein
MRSALVLVASSDTGRRAEIVRAAQQAGHRVVEAVDGVHAVTAATRYVPDLLIADGILPHLDGPQVAATLAKNPDTTDISIVLVGDGPGAEPRDAPPTRVSVESIADVAREMARLLGRRTVASDGIVTLRRALADVRAAAGDSGARDGAEPRVRARQIANSVEESMISVLVADDDARYVEANAAACALCGYSREELLALTIWDLTAARAAGPAAVGSIPARRPVRRLIPHTAADRRDDHDPLRLVGERLARSSRVGAGAGAAARSAQKLIVASSG